MREPPSSEASEEALETGGPPSVPDISAILARFQRMLDDHVDDEYETPVDNSRVEELLVPLRSARAEATRVLLGD